MYVRLDPIHNTIGSPTITYVDRLLRWLSRRDPAEITIIESQGLPEVPGFDVSTAGGYARVCNRLKVMANIMPMQHRTPVSGQIDISFRDGRYLVELECHDRAPDPWLRLCCKPAST
jgi:hypothetical protein